MKDITSSLPVIGGPLARPPVPDHVARMIDEKSALDERLKKLDWFIQSDHFGKLDDIEQHLLAAQSFAMQTYAAILQARLLRAAN